MLKPLSRLFAITFLCLGFMSSYASGQIDVFLDFTTDDHNGSGSTTGNGIADWIDELNQATASAGVSNFSTAERTTIQSNIETHLNTMFSDYNVNFTTTEPTVDHDVIYFGVEQDAGILGFAPFDLGNLFTGDVTNVAPEAFGFFIESGDARTDQVSEISLGLAGTAGHELGHSIGLAHHFAYSNPGISPDNYGSTGGLQNNHIIATGSTGLNEVGRETIRDFAPFSKVMLDITGGAAPVFGGQDNDSLVTGGIISDRTENGTFSTLGTDAGATIATAQTIVQSTGATSGQEIGFIEADLDEAGNTDVDVFKLTTDSQGILSAHVFSSGLRFGTGAEFDAMLELLDSTGTLIPFGSNDDVLYSGNAYDSGTARTTDPFLVNIFLPEAGDYYLRVSSVAGGEEGSNYWLVSGFTSVPEPSGIAFIAITGLAFVCRRRRHQAKN
jgi:hypothetical protein